MFDSDALPRSHYQFVQGRSRESVLLLGTGVLSLRLLSGYSFEGLELIAFSACSSGLATGISEQGVALEGLGGTVLRAGAKSALVTLWDISDLAAPKLSEGFYRAFVLEKASRAGALQRAQLSMLRAAVGEAPDLRHPKAWGAFVVMGEFR